jgi:hypothetical protein
MIVNAALGKNVCKFSVQAHLPLQGKSETLTGLAGDLLMGFPQ